MQEWTLRDLFLVLRHRWRRVAVVFVLLSALGFLRLFLATPIYQAEGKVLFSLSSFPSIGIADNTYISSALIGAEFANRQERLTSLDFLLRVVQALPESIQVRLVQNDTLSPEKVARAIRSDLGITTSREGSVYTLRFVHPDPGVAAAVVNTIMQTFVAEDLRLRRQDVAQSLQYVEEQLARYKAELQDAENRLLAFRKAYGGITLSSLSENLLNELSQVDTRLQDLRARQQELQNRLSSLLSISTDTLGLAASSELQELQKRLVDAEVTYQNLLAQGLPPDQPRMLDLQSEISRLRKTVQEKLLATLHRPDALSLADTLRSAVFWLDVESRVLAGQIAWWEARRREVLQRIATLPELEQEYLQLLRDREIAEKIFRMLTEKREELRVALESRTSPLQILELARTPTTPIRPKRVLEGGLTLLLALFAAVGFALLQEWNRPTLHHLEDLSSLTPAPILTVIPHRPRFSRLPPHHRLFTALPEDDAFREAFLKLYTALFPGFESGQILLWTSATAHEGKSLVLANTALAFREMGHRVAVVEADLRRPHVHLYFDLPQQPGLAEYLLGKSPLQEILNHLDGLTIVPSGDLPPSPTPLLRSPRMEALLRHLRTHHDVVLIDTPPMGLTSDAGLLSSLVEGVILVVRVRVTPLRLLSHVIASLPEGKLRGVVVNGADPAETYGYDGYYGYYRYGTPNGARGISGLLSRLRNRLFPPA